MREPTKEEWDAAMQVVEKYRQPADDLVTELLGACRVQDAERGAAVTAKLHKKRDIRLLMMVLGSLSAKVVIAEREAAKAHGPLLPMPEGIEQAEISAPWATGALDQMQAAVASGDYESFASVAVDSQIKALIHDRVQFGLERIELVHVMRAMMMLDHKTVSVIAAEAMLRLLRMHEGE